MASYGQRYDSIWRESCPRTQLQAPTESDIEPVMQQLPNVIEIVGDAESSLKRRSKDQSDPEKGESVSTGRCCAPCVLM